MIKKLFCFAIIPLFLACETNHSTIDCAAVQCAAPHIQVILLDKTTDANFILENNIDKESIAIHDSTNTMVHFYLNDTNGMLLIDKLNTEDVFEIQINPDIVATISFQSTNPKTNQCCDFGDLKNVLVEQHEFMVEDNLVTIYL